MTTTDRPGRKIKFNMRKFLGLWAAFFLMLIIGMSIGKGTDSVNRNIDLLEGFEMIITTLFGGLLSFIAVLLVIVALGAIIGFGYKVGMSTWDGKKGQLLAISCLPLVLVVLAGYLGFSWITVPTDFGWGLLMLAVFVGLPAAFAFFGAGKKSTAIKPVDPTIATRRRLKETNTNDAGFPVAEPDNNTSITI